MSGCGAKNTISELVLAAVFYLQQSNGVSVMEVAEYIGEKHCCNPCKISRQIKVALNKAKEHGIMSESEGKYRIERKYEDKLVKDDLKPPKNGDDDDDDDGNENGKDDPCEGFDFDRDGENGHKHKHGEGENRANGEGKLEDCIRDPNLADEDGYRGRDLAEPLSKRRKIYLKRDIYDYSESEDFDEDSETCVLDELRDLERRK